ncbi:MAG: hypothetical protein BMS9Abin26_0858 [Gammaproteobacteria bacterium]|nr:MAG: hypothetical protein BMS9Abin26_0858 [Gammaproteobacteria bacterium]
MYLRKYSGDSLVPNTIDLSRLRDFTPLDRLAVEHLKELHTLSCVESFEKGATVFWEGDANQSTSYLVEGEILLTSFEDPRKYFIHDNSDEAKLPISSSEIHHFTVIALTEVTILKVDNSVLDYMSSWNDMVRQQGGLGLDAAESTGEVAVITTATEDTDSVAPLFRHGPYVDNAQLESAMETISLSAGDTVIAQGDAGDFYYILDEGSARVTRVVELAELAAGATFGEEALLSEQPRNATITMTTDGVLRRISRENFHTLFTRTHIKRINSEEARQLINDGAIWLDVRGNAEFDESHLPKALHIPLGELRIRVDELGKEATYICYCKTGKSSTTAAFLLHQRGFKACILDGGLQTLPKLLRLAS